MVLLNEELLNGFLNKLYPIGKTEFFLDNEDHSNYMGFTWQLDCKGRVPVGLDTSDTDFNVIGKTGGSKYLQAHTHKQTANETYIKQTKFNNIDTNYGLSQNGAYGDRVVGGTNQSNVEGVSTQSAGTGNSGNLQPYKVFAIWVRIA